MKNKRVLEIVRILLQQDNFITIQQIATMLQVSNKTIRNDLQVVSEWLEENQMTLCKKTGIGIRIEGSVHRKLKLLEQILARSKRMVDYTPQARKTYIGLRLLNCTERCRIYELSEELFVSRATIHKDLIALQTLLTPYHVELIRKNNQGVLLEGKEYNLRALMFSLMTVDNGYAKLADQVRTRQCKDPSNFLFSALDYTESNFFKILQNILQIKLFDWNQLSFTAILECFLQICILCLRVMDHKFVILSNNFIDELQSKPFYPEACEICDILQPYLQISLPEMERRYLQVHLLAVQNQDQSQNEEEVLQMTHDLLVSWEQIFHRPFTQDTILFEALQSHLGPAITRSRHGIHLANPMMYEIRTYYKNTLQIVCHSLHTLEQKYGCRFSEDEAGYLTIHLAVALDRIKQPLRTILIGHQGAAASNLMIRKLSKYVPEIEIISTQTFISIERIDLSKIDLILSTIPLELDCHIPIVTMHVLPNQHDIQRVRSIVDIYYKKKNDPLHYMEQDLLQC